MPVNRFATRLVLALVAATIGALTAARPAAAGSCMSECARTRHDCLKAARVGGAIPAERQSCRDEFRQCRSCCRNPSTPSYASTWEGIQHAIFEKHGCTTGACHGAAKQGGLDLEPAAAYKSLVEVPSTGSAFARVSPGDERRSSLWLKLAAATSPGALPAGVNIGTPMPNGLAPVSADELELVRRWIYAGAPQSGTVVGTDSLLGACLPQPRPIRIRPLVAPKKGAGIQFTMPTWRLPPNSEKELCFSTYYDVTKEVPAQFRTADGKSFVFVSQELRQDPGSHHLILSRFLGTDDQIHDPAFGKWTCSGGPRAGKVCEPTNLRSCAKKGICTSEAKPAFACIGYGPTVASSRASTVNIGGAQKAQNLIQFPDGVYAAIPMKGILYWNSHAFNLTPRDAVLHAWLNYTFATDTQYFVNGIFDVSKIFAADAAPFTKQDLCNDVRLPQGARLFSLSSHTHRHGEHFWVDGPDGTRLYENFVYNDPPNTQLDPPLAFDSPDWAQRTLHYCATYNNGVKADGSPDVELVTRASHVPPQGFTCKPTACVSGKIAAPCSGVGDDRTCDSAPGAGDGMCDACPITGGESTENEMFILIGAYYRVKPAP